MATKKTSKSSEPTLPAETDPESAESAPEAEEIEAKLPAGLAAKLAADKLAADERAPSSGAEKASTSGKVVRLKIRRQDSREQRDTRRWEEFEVPYLPQMNVHSALEQIRKNPVTTSGKTVAPPVWEAACLEEVCGSCTIS